MQQPRGRESVACYAKRSWVSLQTGKPAKISSKDRDRRKISIDESSKAARKGCREGAERVHKGCNFQSQRATKAFWKFAKIALAHESS